MKIALFGASGLIGSKIKESFSVKVATRDRKERGGNVFFWDPMNHYLNPEDLEGCDCVINLCGENIASSFWTRGKKRNILESRVRTSALIAETILKMDKPPLLFCNASAVGYYGHREDETLVESTPKGKGFLAHVCEKWETAASTAESKCRVCFLRFGVVLSKEGGALKKMLLPFRLFLGGRLGDGNQWMSWISIEEVPKIIEFLYHSSLQGPVNVVAPQPVTNQQFTEVLGEVLSRPTLLPVHALILKTLLGELAEEMLLSSTKVEPQALLKAGYSFFYPNLKEALKVLV